MEQAVVQEVVHLVELTEKARQDSQVDRVETQVHDHIRVQAAEAVEPLWSVSMEQL